MAPDPSAEKNTLDDPRGRGARLPNATDGPFGPWPRIHFSRSLARLGFQKSHAPRKIDRVHLLLRPLEKNDICPAVIDALSNQQGKRNKILEQMEGRTRRSHGEILTPLGIRIVVSTRRLSLILPQIPGRGPFQHGTNGSGSTYQKAFFSANGQ